MRTALLSFFAIAVAAVAAAAGPAILTAPLGLVNGVLEVEVDLGGSTGSATLYLDGVEACAPTENASSCRVDLGPGLHVHLLELVVTGTDGGVQRVERWLNRPGYEADLEIELASRPIGNICGGRLNWFDVHGQQPADLEADAAGERLAVSPDTRTFGYPCAEFGSTEVVTAEVVFGDGRRGAAVARTADSGKLAGSEPQLMVLEVKSSGADSCANAVDSVSGAVAGAEPQGFEVAFVLDPTVKPAGLAGLGGGGMTSAWDLATTALSDADRLWFVRPDSSFERRDGFAEGRDIWLGSFFQLASSPAPAELILVDAVATAGLTAGAAPRRRAVVLVLGSGQAADTSRFSVEQVRSYLAEIGVPLQVIRTEQVRSDGWPTGVKASSLDGFAVAVDGIRDRIDAQCIAWFPALLEQRQIAELLPRGVAVAGRSESGSSGEPVWRRADLTGTVSDSQLKSGEAFEGEQVEVTAVEVLVRAHDGKGNPIIDLDAGDLQVTEDGQTVPVLQLEQITSLSEEVEATPPSAAATEPFAPLPARKIVPVSVYVERRLAGTTDIAPAIDALIEQADWLTSLGPVDIVVAERTVDTILEGATDPGVVRGALKNVGQLTSHGHAIEGIRTDYVRQILEYPDRGITREGEAGSDSLTISSSTPDNMLRVRTMTAARISIFEEDALLRSTMERMNDWAMGLRTSGPRLLFLVGTGFDEDPIDFYVRFIEMKDPSLGTAARAEFVRYNQATRVDSVGRELAAAGWMVIPVATRIAGRQRSAAEFSGRETFQAFLTDRTDGPYLSDVDFMLLDPLGAQQHLAAPSGGKVIVGGRGLDELITESSGWYRLTYQVARAPDGVLHEVSVTSDRSEISVESTGVVVSGTSEGRAAMRLRKMLDDPSAAGELAVRVDVGPARSTDGKVVEASLIASVDLAPIAPLFAADGARALRFSIGVRSGPGVPFVSHSVVTAAGAVGGMQFEAPIQWSGDGAELAVVVEDLGSGAWGGTVSRLTN